MKYLVIVGGWVVLSFVAGWFVGYILHRCEHGDD